MKNIYQDGYDARWQNKSIEECPYCQNPEKDEWEVGWLAAENDYLQDEYYGGNWPGSSSNPL